MKKYIKPLVLLLIVCIFLGFATGAFAKDPWEWKFSLRGKDTKIAMLLPSAVFVDAGRERFYVADSGNNRLLSFDKEGKFLDTFDANGTLKTPFDVYRDSEGVFWVVERGRNTLTSINLKSKDIKNYELENSGNKIIPDRMAIDDAQVYIIDKVTGEIFKLDAQLKTEKFLKCDTCDGGFTDFVIRQGQIYALDQLDKTIYIYSKNGTLKDKVSLPAELQFPFAIEVDNSGMLYVLDRHDGAIIVLSQKGEIKYRFLGEGQVRGRLYLPEDLLFDPWGRLCIVDAGNGRVEVYSR